MKRPPVLMRVQIRGEERKFRLWLPLFLPLPLALLLLIIFSPLILVVVIIVRMRAHRRHLSPVVTASLGNDLFGARHQDCFRRSLFNARS